MAGNLPVVKHYLRKLGLMHPVHTLRYFWERKKYKAVNNAFKKEYPDVVLPPDYLLYEAYYLHYENYYKEGRKTAQWLKDILDPYTNWKGQHILDWGCGPARIIRHLPELLPDSTEIYGTDYNAASIEWCKRTFKQISFATNQLSPPTDYPSEQFDVIYGLSIFTHLSEANHYAWYKELSRILKKGGLLLLSTQGDIYQERLTPSELARYKQGHLVTRGGVKEGHDVFVAYHPPSFMKALSSQYCEILEHIPGVEKHWGLEQDVWIFRKW